MSHINLSPSDVRANITADDLQKYRHLIPETGLALIAALGDDDGLKVLNVLSGVQMSIPRRPCIRTSAWTWNYLTDLFGEACVQKLANTFGGQLLSIPTLNTVRLMRRNTAIVQQHQLMTSPKDKGGEYLTNSIAIVRLTLLYRPLTFRQITEILNSPLDETNLEPASLFE